MIFGPAFDAGKSEFFSLFRLGKRENEWDLLNDLIDAMPMRQQEIQRKKS